VVAIVLLALLAFGINHSGANNSIAYSVAGAHYKPAPDAGKQLPSVESATSGADLASQSLASHRGQFVLVNFFASWCAQCQQEAPILAEAEAVLKAHGGTVLGIDYEEGPDTAASYIKKYGVDYPVVVDAAGRVASAYGVSGVPDSYLVAPNGKIVWLNLYELTPTFIHTTLPELLTKFA
jgi:cytochrome c biogenesis protein CcmG/thiol:disulfide interchange protein DsbE